MEPLNSSSPDEIRGLWAEINNLETDIEQHTEGDTAMEGVRERFQALCDKMSKNEQLSKEQKGAISSLKGSVSEGVANAVVKQSLAKVRTIAARALDLPTPEIDWDRLGPSEQDDVSEQLLEQYESAGSPFFRDVDEKGQTELHRIAFTEVGTDPTARKVLIEKSDLNERDFKGNTPLHLAILSGQVGLACELIDAGCDLLAENKGITPLALAGTIDNDNSLLIYRHATEKVAQGLLEQVHGMEGETASPTEFLPGVLPAVIPQVPVSFLKPLTGGVENVVKDAAALEMARRNVTIQQAAFKEKLAEVDARIRVLQEGFKPEVKTPEMKSIEGEIKIQTEKRERLVSEQRSQYRADIATCAQKVLTLGCSAGLVGAEIVPKQCLAEAMTTTALSALGAPVQLLAVYQKVQACRTVETKRRQLLAARQEFQTRLEIGQKALPALEGPEKGVRELQNLYLQQAVAKIDTDLISLDVEKHSKVVAGACNSLAAACFISAVANSYQAQTPSDDYDPKGWLPYLGGTLGLAALAVEQAPGFVYSGWQKAKNISLHSMAENMSIGSMVLAEERMWKGISPEQHRREVDCAQKLGLKVEELEKKLEGVLQDLQEERFRPHLANIVSILKDAGLEEIFKKNPREALTKLILFWAESPVK